MEGIIQQYGDFQSVYAEIKIVSKRFLARERANHTLNSTAPVHDAYMQMSRKEEIPWHDRHHFFAVASQVMRRILVDHAALEMPRNVAGFRSPFPWKMSPTTLARINWM